MLEEQRIRVNQHFPQASPLFTGAMERPEDYERRQRQQRVEAILKKHEIGQRPGPWWRI